jgi:hypothetical protein
MYGVLPLGKEVWPTLANKYVAPPVLVHTQRLMHMDVYIIFLRYSDVL